ncbi:DUF1640 domain-containing protein [Methyloglobulus sp.]|uniref:DUF1640 domain-containing protein n=1 Tax=Methyloglobulus sp. TaxID=2518622 RepID=UPI00398A0A92
MATVTFDTLELVEKLVKSGIEQKQAETIVRVIAEAQESIVTKDYLDIKLAPINTDLAVLKWMMGVLLAGVISLVLKAFF